MSEILPIRKSTRLKGYNYNTPGAYFLTICVKNRAEILSEIKTVDGVSGIPENTLLPYGIIADKYINKLNDFYKNISVDKYVIMPNHIHLLVRISECGDGGSSRTPNPTNSLIAQFVSTFKRFCNKEYGENIWQRLSNDHIIRNENDYKRIWEYIDTNVFKLEQDCFYIKKNNI